jgi:hypothetical protein
MKWESWRKELEAIKKADVLISGNELYYLKAQYFCDQECLNFMGLIGEQDDD